MFEESSTVSEPDDYWKLDSYLAFPYESLVELSGRTINQTEPRIQREQLERELQRKDRGLLSYHTCTDEELRAFCRSRASDWLQAKLKKGQPSRVTLLRKLSALDEQLNFPSFSSLPPEVRNRIYRFYFSSFRTTLSAVSQPPLTKVSTMLRSETIQMFYASCRFELNIVMCSKGMVYDGEINIPTELLLMISLIKAEYLNLIKDFAIQVVGFDGDADPARPEPLLKLNMRYDPKSKSYTILHEVPDGIFLCDAQEVSVGLERYMNQNLPNASLRRSLASGFSLTVLFESRAFIERAFKDCGLSHAYKLTD